MKSFGTLTVYVLSSSCVLLCILFMIYLESDVSQHALQRIFSSDEDTQFSVQNLDNFDYSLGMSNQDDLKSQESLNWGKTLYSPVRIVCGVPTTYPDNLHRWKRIARTWGKHCDKLYWVLSSNSSVPSPSEIPGGVGEVMLVDLKYEPDEKSKNIWDKSQRMWRELEEKHSTEGEWFLKLDDDTFLVVENLRNYVSFYHPGVHHYLGHTILYRWGANIVFNSGIAYCLSRASLHAVAPLLRTMPSSPHGQWHSNKCEERPGSSEDAAMGICLRQLGIQPDNTLDEYGRERFLTFHVSTHKSMERKDDDQSWFWKYKSPEVGVMENCCSPNIIATHSFKTDSQKNEDFFDELQESYQMKALNISRESLEIPPHPKSFLYDPNLPFHIDHNRNFIKNK